MVDFLHVTQHYCICDLSCKNVQQRFSVEWLKPLATHWVSVGGVDESVEGVGKAVGFFSLPVGGVEKSHWVLFPYPLKALRKAVGKIRPTRCYSAVNSLIYSSD